MTTTDTPRAAAPRSTAMITEAELAERLGVSVRTLQRYRVSGDGPEWTRMGPRRGTIRYTEHDVAAWLERRKAAKGKS